MNLYGKIPYLFIFILSFYRQVFVESTDETLSEIPKTLKHRNRLDQYIPIPSDDSSSEFSDPEFCLISCNIKKKANTDRIEYRRNDSKKTDTFIARFPFLFWEVTRNAHILWTADDRRYFSRVVVKETDSGRSFFRIYFRNEATESDIEYEQPSDQTVTTIPHYVPPSTPKEQPEEPGKDVIPVITIDLGYKQQNKYFNYERNEEKNTDTYTTNQPYLIKKIVDKNEVLWQSKNGMFSFRATYKPDPNSPKLQVFFPEDQTPIPVEQEEPEPTPDITTQPEELPKDEPEAKYHPPEPEPMIYSQDQGPMYPSSQEPMYEPMPKPQDKTRSQAVFKFSSESEPEPKPETPPMPEPEEKMRREPRPMPVPKAEQEPEATSELEFTPIPRGYVETEIPAPKNIPITLDIEFKFGTYLFDYSRCNNLAVYTPKEGFVFVRVKRNDKFYCMGRDVIIWQTHDPDIFSTKVHVIANNRAIIHLNNGKTLFYMRGFDCIWERIDKTTYNPIDWNHLLIDLDLRSKRSTQYYEYFCYENYMGRRKATYEYIVRDKFRFKMIHMGRTQIWRAYNDKELAYKIGVYTAIGGTEQVTVFLVNGTTRTFFRQSYGFGMGTKWMEERIGPVTEQQYSYETSSRQSPYTQTFQEPKPYTPMSGPKPYTPMSAQIPHTQPVREQVPYSQTMPEQRSGVHFNIPNFTDQIKDKFSKISNYVDFSKIYNKNPFYSLFPKTQYTSQYNGAEQVRVPPARSFRDESSQEKRKDSYSYDAPRKYSQQYYEYSQSEDESQQYYRGDMRRQSIHDYKPTRAPRSHPYNAESDRMRRTQPPRDDYTYRRPEARPQYPETQEHQPRTYRVPVGERHSKPEKVYHDDKPRSQYVNFKG